MKKESIVQQAETELKETFKKRKLGIIKHIIQRKINYLESANNCEIWIEKISKCEKNVEFEMLTEKFWESTKSHEESIRKIYNNEL